MKLVSCPPLLEGEVDKRDIDTLAYATPSRLDPIRRTHLWQFNEFLGYLLLFILVLLPVWIGLFSLLLLGLFHHN